MPVLATKLHAPVPRGRLVRRARLTEALDSLLEPGQRLGLVSAPAGFGKTTLISTWAGTAVAASPESSVSVAWVSLDEDDNDLRRVLAHIVAALDRAGVPLEHDPIAGTSTMDVSTATAVLTAIVNRLTEHEQTDTEPTDEKRRWLLVLDDYHVIVAPEVQDTITYLLEHLPERLRVLVSTRSDPALPVARLRSRGQLVELRAADLRFTHDEAGDFLNKIMELDLGSGDVQALDDRTEGWAAGLQLAGLSLRGRSQAADVSEFIDAFTGSNRFVVDYLADEVLALQSPETRAFLLRTSVLDRLTGSLCDAVTGTHGGAETLIRLDRDNLFLVPLDDERTWYRYHHLFADVLRSRLLASEPALVPVLHRAASDWYADRDALEDAVRHALAAQDHVRAGRLVERGLSQLRRTRQDALLLAWLRALPDDVVRPHPVLSTAVGWSAMMAGDLEAFERHLDDADAALAAATEDPEVGAAWVDTEDLQAAEASVHLYRAALAQARGDTAGTEAHARAALGLAQPQDHFIRGGGSGFLGLAAWARGDVEEALSTFEQAGDSLRAAGNHVDALDTTIVLADMWIAAGRPSRARDLCERTLHRATANGEPYPRATADLHTCLAELALGRDELAEADDELTTAATLAERASITENRHRWPAVAASLRAAVGDYAAALGLLDEATELHRPGFYPELRPLTSAKARVQLMAGDLEAASRWASVADVRLGDDPRFDHEYQHLTLARVQLARHRHQPAQTDLTDVLELLERLEGTAAQQGRLGSALEIRMLQALTLAASGDDRAAAKTLADALEAAPEVDSFVRLFRDEGPAMTALLEQVAGLPASSGSGTSVALAQRLLQHADAAQGSTTTSEALLDPLSDREQEVLRLLQGELSGPDIARQLFISLNTLRTHTKRIFTKLGVNSRAAAIRRGRELDLI